MKLTTFLPITPVLVAENPLSFTMDLNFDPSFNSPSNELYQYVLSVVSSDSALTLKVDTKQQRSLKTVTLLADQKWMWPTHSRTARCRDKRVPVSMQVGWSYCQIFKSVNVCMVCVQTHKQKLEALCDLVPPPWFMVWMVHLWFWLFSSGLQQQNSKTPHTRMTVKWSIHTFNHIFPISLYKEVLQRVGWDELKGANFVVHTINYRISRFFSPVYYLSNKSMTCACYPKNDVRLMSTIKHLLVDESQ